MADAGTLTLDPVLAPALQAPAEASPPTSSRTSPAVLAAAALVIAAGAAIRFAALSTSVWFDESGTVLNVSGSFGQMLRRVATHEVSPPFYFVCIWIWRQLVGATAVDLRTLSAVPGAITIGLAFYVARRRIGPRAGLILAACVAVSPVLFYYSTELRMYGLLVLLTGIGFEAFLCASESPSSRNLTVWATASILALWTHYYAAVAVAPQAAWLIGLAWRSRRRSRMVLVAVGSVAVTSLPLIYLMLYQTHRAFGYAAGVLSSVWQRYPLSIHTYPTVGGLADDLVVGPGGPARSSVTLLTLLFTLIVFAGALRASRITQGQLIRALVLLAPAVLIVETLIYLHVQVSGRYLLPVWLPVGLGVSYLFASTKRLGLALAVGLVCAWVAVGVVSWTVPKFAPRDDTLGAARSLGVAVRGRLIAINEPWDVLAFQEYRPQTSTETNPVVRVRELDVVAMPAGGEPPPSVHQRPSSLGVGVLPPGLRLAQEIRGSTFLIERFVALTPVAIRIDGHGNAFTSTGWRFLAEPAGGRLGVL